MSTSQLQEFTFQENLFDENYETKVVSNGEFEPYIEIKIEKPSDVASINIIGDIRKYYIFFSLKSMVEMTK